MRAEGGPAGGGESDLAILVERARDVFRRRRKSFLVISLATFLLVHAAGFFLPGKFVARAALLVQPPRSTSPLRSDPDQPATVMSEGVTEEVVLSETAIMTSHEVLAATVDATGMALVRPPWYLRALFAPIRAYEYLYALHHDVPYPSQFDRVVRGLGESLSIERMKDSNVLVVSFTSGDPEVAEVVLGELLKHYLDRHVSVHGQLRANAFLTSQAEILEGGLEEHEESLRRIRQAAGVVDVTEELQIQLQIDADLREEQQLLGRRLAEVTGMLGQYDAMMAGSSSERLASAEGMAAGDVPDDLPLATPRIDELKSEILRLDLERIGLESRYADGFPLVLENWEKLEAAREALAREERNIGASSPTLLEVHKERARLQAESRGLRERLEVLGRQLDLSRDRLNELDAAGVDAQRAERLLETTEERYRVLLTLGERARIEEALDRGRITNVSVVQEPVGSPKPVTPKKTILLLVSVVGGLLSGLMGLLLLEVRRLGLARFLSLLAPREAT